MATNNSRAKRVNENEPEEVKVDKPIETEAEVKKPLVVKDIDPSEFVIVRNGFNGRLVYKSPRTGERFIWREFGDELEMELRELRTAKTRHKKFFEQNWFMFDEPWIAEYLGVTRYYKNALSLNEFDELFKKRPNEIRNIISKLSDGQKRSVGYMARNKIANKEIDSIRAIEALEESLGIELIEK